MLRTGFSTKAVSFAVSGAAWSLCAGGYGKVLWVLSVPLLLRTPRHKLVPTLTLTLAFMPAACLVFQQVPHTCSALNSPP